MPFASKAQQGYLHAHPEVLGEKKLAEFDAATKGMHNLPDNKDKTMAKKHDYTHSTTEHHDDGSHTTTHHHKDGKSHKKYASANHDQMMKGMADNVGPVAEPAAASPAGPVSSAPPAVVPGA